MNGAWSATPRLKLGVEFNAAAGEWTPTANWIVFLQNDRHPGLSIGTSSDRIFTPPGYQAVFASLQQSFGKFGVYAGPSYSGFEERLLFPFGVSYSGFEQFTPLLMQDGRNTHLLVTHSGRQVSTTVMWLGFRRFGISTSVKF